MCGEKVRVRDIERLSGQGMVCARFSTAPSFREPDGCACTPEHKAWPGEGGKRDEELNMSG
jgi:hypothetical protein